MGQGDVDGDKYYVLSERSLFPPPTAENVAADYGSQTEQPVHRRSRGGAGPCAPAADHPDADLAAAFAMCERLVAPGKGGALALGTWQGIYLIEHRDRPHRREIVLSVLGA